MRPVLRALSAAAAIAFGAAPAASGVSSREILRTRTTWDGAPLALPALQKPEVQGMVVEIAPGSATAWHKHPANHFAYVLEGAIRVELEGAVAREFKAGDAFAEVVGTWHRGVSTGAVPVKLVVFDLGESGAPASIPKPQEPAPVRARP
jgi:quercetin dioxygenase-like cupin family protein